MTIKTDERIAVVTAGAPSAIGPYSQAIASNGLLFISGQLPINPATGEFPAGDITAQTEQSLKNIAAIVEEAGASMKDIVKTTCLLDDINDFAAMNEVYEKFLSQNITGVDAPARAAYAVKDLPKGARIEIEAIARLNYK